VVSGVRSTSVSLFACVFVCLMCTGSSAHRAPGLSVECGRPSSLPCGSVVVTAAHQGQRLTAWRHYRRLPLPLQLPPGRRHGGGPSIACARMNVHGVVISTGRCPGPPQNQGGVGADRFPWPREGSDFLRVPTTWSPDRQANVKRTASATFMASRLKREILN
jgi:hypothetical protein